MGKAKRFNSYDGAVDEHRKIVQNYGVERQRLSIGSSFRSMPLSPPIATTLGNGTTSTGTGTYLVANLAANQTSNLAANDHIEYDTKLDDGGIVLQTGAGQLDGIFELKAGKKYVAMAGASVVFTGAGPATGFLNFRWYDVTNTTYHGNTGELQATTNTNHDNPQYIATAIFAPSTDIEVEVRVVSSTQTPHLEQDDTFATIFELGGGGAGSGSGVTFPITPTINDHGNVGTTTEDLDLSASTGHVHKITLTGDPTLTFSNPPTSGTQMEFEIEFVQDATGGRTVTWPGTVAETVTISSIAAATTIVTVRTNDGGTTYHAIPALRGSISLGGLLLSNVTVDTAFDANGIHKFVLDADADTYLIGDTDDQIEFFTGATEKLRINTEVQLQGGVNLDINGNDIILDTAGNTKIRDNAGTLELDASGATRVSIDAINFNTDTNINMTSTGVELDLNSNLLRLDADGDTFITLSTDDQLRFTISGVSDSLIIQALGKLEWGSTGVNHDLTPSATAMTLNLSAITDDFVIQHAGSTKSTIFSNNQIAFTSDTAGFNLATQYSPSVPADSDVFATMDFGFKNSTGTLETWGSMIFTAQDVTNATEDSKFEVQVFDSGTLVTPLIINGLTGRFEINGMDLDVNSSTIRGITDFSLDSTPDITGSRDNNAALADLLTSLASIGLITDSTTAT